MSDSPAVVAQTPAAPPDERYDAQAAFQRAGLPDFIPASELEPVIDFINDGYAAGVLAKGGNVLRFPARGPAHADEGRGGVAARSVILDDFQVSAMGDYWDRPGLLGFEGMKAMVEQTPILNGVVLKVLRRDAGDEALRRMEAVWSVTLSGGGGTGVAVASRRGSGVAGAAKPRAPLPPVQVSRTAARPDFSPARCNASSAAARHAWRSGAGRARTGHPRSSRSR